MVQQSLGIGLDEQTINRAIKRIGEVRQSVRDLSATVKASEPIAGKFGDTLRGAFSSQTSKRIADIADQTEGFKRETVAATKAVNDLRAAQNKPVRAQERFKTATEQQGDISTTFSALGSLAGGSETASLISDLTGVAEYLPRFADAVRGIPDAARTAYQAIGATGVGLGAGLIAFAAIAAIASAANERYASSVRAVLQGQEEYFKLLQTGTTESVQEVIASKKAELEIQKAVAERNQFYLQELENQVGSLGRGVADIFNLGGVKETREAAQAAEAKIAALETQIKDLEATAGSAEIALNDAAAAQDRYNAALVAGVQQQIATQTQINSLIREGTAEQIRSRIAANLDEQAALVANIATLQALASTSEDAQKALDQAQARLNQLSTETGRLQSEVLPLIDAREKEMAVIKDQEQVLKDLAGATDKYNKDVEALENRANEARAASAERLNDALVKAAESAAEAAENALAKLEEKRNDLAADFAQDSANAFKEAQLEQLDAQITFQRDEARARREHARNLLQIQKDAAAREQDLIDARDFAGLFDLRRDTQKRLNEANQAFVSEQAERRIAYAEQLSDLATAYQRERETRALQYQQDLNDAALQYQREQKQIEVNRNKALVAANAAYNREIQLTNDKYNRELTQRQQAISAELSLIRQGGQARIALEAQIQKALVQQAYNILAGLGGSTPGGSGGGQSSFSPIASAFGNNLAAMQASTFNELPGQRERFGGQLLPGGKGLIIPLRGGQVSPGSGGGVSFSMPVTINAGGGNVQQIEGAMNAIKPKMKQFIIDTMAEVVGAD